MASTTPSPLAAAVTRELPKFKSLDPQAVLAVAAQEGIGGGIGDNGTSFGPWQLHQGGAYPSFAPQDPQAAQQWASSPAGIDYALAQQAKVAGGLKGNAAIQALVTRFERPANPQREIAGAQQAYGGLTASPGQQAPHNSLVAATTGPAAQPPQTPFTDFRPKLASQLAQAANTQTNDLRSFYGTLHQALEQKQQGPVAAGQDASFHGTSQMQQVAAALPRTQVGASIAKTALTQIGTPYQWGGPAKLGARTDCSGLLQASAAANGVKIGRTTYEQWKQGIPVPLNQLQPGDAVFFHMGEQGPGHVAIYIGGGKVVEDPHTGAAVEISQLAGRGAVGARRYG